VNLTDGLNGLAAGLTVVAVGAFAIFCYLFGRVDAARYLGVLYLPGAGELTIFCGALIGASLGFLWFNAYPAQVFMGDTGALAIGGALGTIAILLKTEFLLLISGAVFAAETLSVLIQTSAYKWRKRRYGKEYADAHRVFRMAPLHHHFEKLGWAEPQVVMRFYILGVLSAMIALATLKVRRSSRLECRSCPMSGAGPAASSQSSGSAKAASRRPGCWRAKACESTRATRRTIHMPGQRPKRSRACRGWMWRSAATISTRFATRRA